MVVSNLLKIELGTPKLVCPKLICRCQKQPVSQPLNSDKPTMEMQRLRALAVEIFKFPNEISSPFMKNIFTLKENTKLRQNDTIVNYINISRFGTQSLRSLDPKIWNNLPSNIKSEIFFLKFKEYIKTWLGPNCKCKSCINRTKNVLLFDIYIYEVP